MRLLEFARESGWKSAREAAVRGGNGYEIFETRNDGLLRRRDP
jgi:hypothetical protein